MNLSREKIAAFTVAELMVCVAVVAILIWLAIPGISTTANRGGSMTGALSNARQLHLATQTMSLDTFNSGSSDGMAWTTLKTKGKSSKASLQQYFDALTNNNYLTQKDLQKLLSLPRKGPGNDVPSAENSAFKFFWVDEDSPEDQPFLVSANWEDRRLTSNPPYGKKGFIVFAKGGSGGIYRRPADVSSVKIFPTGSRDGHAYHDDILK